MNRQIVRQHAFVVPDVEDAMRFWTDTLGVGPFFYLPRSTAPITYRGAEATIELSICLAQSGSVQIELLQQHDDVPSLLTEFTDDGRTGFHHVAFWTHDFDRLMNEYAAQGREPIQSANPGGGPNRNCFFATGDPSCWAVEISETSGSKGRLFAEITRAADGWDGREPVRRLQQLGLPAER